MAVGEAHVFPGFLIPVLLMQLSFQSHQLLSHILQKWEAKILRKENSPQPGIKLTNIKSSVWHTHHWATLAGRRKQMQKKNFCLCCTQNDQRKVLWSKKSCNNSFSLVRTTYNITGNIQKYKYVFSSIFCTLKLVSVMYTIFPNKLDWKYSVTLF